MVVILIAEQGVRLMIMQCGVEVWAHEHISLRIIVEYMDIY